MRTLSCIDWRFHRVEVGDEAELWHERRLKNSSSSSSSNNNNNNNNNNKRGLIHVLCIKGR